MKKITICLVLALLCLNFNLIAQQNNFKRLNIGDRFPNLTFDNVLNHKSETLELSNFKGKAIIIDFWATYCGTCISVLPHLKQFQTKHKKNLQFILFDTDLRQTKDIINNFLEKQKKEFAEVIFPIVTKDQRIFSLFPHKSIPHYVWIGADGRIKAITGVDELTSVNIERLIAGLSLSLPIKEGI
ncbi:MAG: TlpA family protein disulfide reductase [Acinetobacter sp.]|nr:MAG: TlpA family protein disulfide reductase [Acinetobacter sp.]